MAPVAVSREASADTRGARLASCREQKPSIAQRTMRREDQLSYQKASEAYPSDQLNLSRLIGLRYDLSEVGGIDIQARRCESHGIHHVEHIRLEGKPYLLGDRNITPQASIGPENTRSK